MERDIYDEDHEAFRDLVREFVKRHVTNADRARWDADGEVDRDTMKAAAEADWSFSSLLTRPRQTSLETTS